VTRTLPTAQFASLVYGADCVPLDDPAEAFHEASRLYPSLAPERLGVLIELARSPALGETVARASRTHDHRPAVGLPDPEPLRGRLDGVLARRRSRRVETLRPVRLAELSSVLAVAYAAIDRPGGAARRFIPSAGALYPLEVYVIALAVDGLERGVYHYNPFGHRLASLGPVAWTAVRAALAEPAVIDQAAALLVVTAVFWRSRFKYGQRGYRFSLLEAGHLVQNAVLAAADLDLPALPLGGFYDRRLDAIVGVDGLDEATVYALVLGGAA
jgi:SagB-type dehydrogenase family enzyme